jgi:hypothetical protein
MAAETTKNVRGVIYAMILGLFSTVTAKATLVDSNSVIRDGVAYYMATDKAVYDLGDEVDMLYRVTNLTDASVAVGTVYGDEEDWYTFRVIMEDGSQVWEYFHFTGVTDRTAYHLGPYQSGQFLTSWNMMNDNGTPGLPNDDFPISPGPYNVIGELNLLNGERVPVSVSITVIPEPGSSVLFAVGLAGLILTRGSRNQKRVG